MSGITEPGLIPGCDAAFDLFEESGVSLVGQSVRPPLFSPVPAMGPRNVWHADNAASRHLTVTANLLYVVNVVEPENRQVKI